MPSVSHHSLSVKSYHIPKTVCGQWSYFPESAAHLARLSYLGQWTHGSCGEGPAKDVFRKYLPKTGVATNNYMRDILLLVVPSVYFHHSTPPHLQMASGMD